MWDQKIINSSKRCLDIQIRVLSGDLFLYIFISVSFYETSNFHWSSFQLLCSIGIYLFQFWIMIIMDSERETFKKWYLSSPVVCRFNVCVTKIFIFIEMSFRNSAGWSSPPVLPLGMRLTELKSRDTGSVSDYFADFQNENESKVDFLDLSDVISRFSSKWVHQCFRILWSELLMYTSKLIFLFIWLLSGMPMSRH